VHRLKVTHSHKPTSRVYLSMSQPSDNVNSKIATLRNGFSHILQPATHPFFMILS